MTPLQRRFKYVIERLGDPFEVDAQQRMGVFAVLAGAKASDLLTETEQQGAALPMYLAYVPFDDTTALSETVAWNGRSLAVAKAIDCSFQGATIVRILALT